MTDSIITVTSAASSYDLVSLAGAKLELGITDTASDTLLATWITQTSSDIAVYIGRTLARETVSQDFDLTSGLVFLRLTRRPVASITSVTEDGILLDTTDYQVEPNSGLLRRRFSDGGRTGWRALRVVVVYVGGYVLPDDLNPTLTRACYAWLKHRWASKDRDPGLRSVNVPGVQEESYFDPLRSSGSGGVPDEVSTLLDMFRGGTVA